MAANGKNIDRIAGLRSVDVTLEYGVEADQVVLVSGILGLTVESGASGATNHPIEIMPCLIDIELPGAVYDACSFGTKLYIVVANVTGYALNTDAITTTASTNIYLGFFVEGLDDTNHYARIAFEPERA